MAVAPLPYATASCLRFTYTLFDIDIPPKVKYKEKFDKEKGKRPQYDMKESKSYQTFKDANVLASEVQ